MAKIVLLLLAALLIEPAVADAKIYRQYSHKLEFALPDN